MRTRSQPDSPGGFVSLDDMKNATRRTRTTRSASRAASQEPAAQGSSSQPSSSEQPTESTTQPTTRSKTQKRTVKKTTTKKSTSAASSSKPQTRTSKRTTRSSKRKTDEAEAGETQEHIIESSFESARTNDDDDAEANTEEPASTSDNALLEPKNSEREYNLSPLSSDFPPFTSSFPSPSCFPFLSQILESQAIEGDAARQTQNNVELQTSEDVQDSFNNWESYQGLLSTAVPMEPGELDTFDLSEFSDILRNLSDDELALQESSLSGFDRDFPNWSLSEPSFDIDPAIMAQTSDDVDKINEDINAMLNQTTVMTPTSEDVDKINADINAMLDQMARDMSAGEFLKCKASSVTSGPSSTAASPPSAIDRPATNQADPDISMQAVAVDSASFSINEATSRQAVRDSLISQNTTPTRMTPPKPIESTPASEALQSMAAAIPLPSRADESIESEDPDAILQLAAAVPLPSDVDDFAISQTAPAPAGLKESEHPDDEQVVLSPIASVSAQALSFVEEHDINELIGAFSKFSIEELMAEPESLPEASSSQVIANTTSPHLTVVSGAPAATFRASIYDPVPPSVPATLFTPEEQVQQLLAFCLSIADSHTSIYGDGQAPPTCVTTARQQSTEEVLYRSADSVRTQPAAISRRSSRTLGRRRLRGWPNTPLSPITEERGIPSPWVIQAASSRQTTTWAAPIEPEPSWTASMEPSGTACGDQDPRKEIPKCHKATESLKTPKSKRTLRESSTQGGQQAHHTHISSVQNKSKRKRKLTKKKVNRKRSRTETSDDNAEPVTPYANKRRNLGTPGSTPFARHLTPLARRLSRTAPRSERMLRRRAESQGRIHSTIFRLPEFVAQTEADRRASEATSSTPPAQPLQPDFDTSSEQAQTDDEVVAEQPAAAEEPSTPEPARSGWNFSGLFGSVPRSFSRFLPRFGRSPASSEVSATQQPASERIGRTRPSEARSTAASEEQTKSRRRSTDERPAKRARNLSFSLYPARIDRSLYLGDVPTKTTDVSVGSLPAPAPASQPAHQDTPQETLSDTSTTPSGQHHDRTSRANDTASESQRKKRKRSPSPDVIPNPAGSSYGMDLDYFCYSSESEDDETAPSVPQTEPRKNAAHGKSALRGTAQTEKPAEKKAKKNVHFGVSPEGTPSKLRRARATDPYNGTHFVGMGGPQASSAPTTPTPASRVQDPRERPGFVPNRSGTFELDYDAFSDDSDSSSAPSPSVAAPSPVASTPTSATPATPQSAPLPAPRSTGRPATAPSTPAETPAVARARASILKHAPKTPSSLYQTQIYPSPTTSPGISDPVPTSTPTVTSSAAVEKDSEEFGDDQFAQEAQWLFENCPSGDLSQLKWPEPRPFGEGLNVSAEAIRIVNEIWEPADVDKAHAIFQREFAEFKKTLA